MSSPEAGLPTAGSVIQDATSATASTPASTSAGVRRRVRSRSSTAIVANTNSPAVPQVRGTAGQAPIPAPRRPAGRGSGTARPLPPQFLSPSTGLVPPRRATRRRRRAARGKGQRQGRRIVGTFRHPGGHPVGAEHGHGRTGQYELDGDGGRQPGHECGNGQPQLSVGVQPGRQRPEQGQPGGSGEADRRMPEPEQHPADP